MHFFQLPFSNLKISRIGFGAWPIAGGFNWGPQDGRDSKEALKTAYELGINFFDTAEGYGNGKSEALIAEVLGNKRDKVIIATKASPKHFGRDDLKKACEERLKALKTDYIDLFQLHWPNHEIPLEETVQALDELKTEGKIRAWGISNFGTYDLQNLLSQHAAPSSNQLPYNLLWRAIEFELLPLCRKKDIPVLCYMPIMQGMLTGKFSSADEVPEDRARSRHFAKSRPQARHNEEGAEKLTFETIEKIRAVSEKLGISMGNLSMGWLLAKQGVAGVIVGARNAYQVQKNVEAANINLSQDVTQELDKITEPLKQELEKNPDIWQSNSRYR